MIYENLPEIEKSKFNFISEKQINELLLNFNGELIVNENGDLIYRFKSLYDDLNDIKKERNF